MIVQIKFGSNKFNYKRFGIERYSMNQTKKSRIKRKKGLELCHMNNNMESLQKNCVVYNLKHRCIGDMIQV